MVPQAGRDEPDRAGPGTGGKDRRNLQIVYSFLTLRVEFRFYTRSIRSAWPSPSPMGPACCSLVQASMPVVTPSRLMYTLGESDRVPYPR